MQITSERANRIYDALERVLDVFQDDPIARDLLGDVTVHEAKEWLYSRSVFYEAAREVGLADR